jgi:catechol 2,3-dioxygenase-like lactoylglutathione lyase family enzyme
VPKILGFHHVQLAMPAEGEEDARRFYGVILGLDEVRKPSALASRGGCWFRGADVEIHLGVEEGFRPARKAHPALLLDDLDAMQGRLAAAGHETIEDAELDGRRRFHTADPFGNRLELIATA